MSWNHRTSKPHQSETNGIAERAVRRVKEGTSAVLLQSGLDEKWWADSMECSCHLRSVQDLLADGKTPYERRFGESFKGPIFPFGASVEYYPMSARDQARLHQCGKKVLPGIFLEFALIAGGIWKGYILIADIEGLENLEASEIYIRRMNAKEVLITRRKENLYFLWQMVHSKIVRKRPRIPRTHSETEANRKERVSVEILMAKWKSLNLQNKK